MSPSSLERSYTLLATKGYYECDFLDVRNRAAIERDSRRKALHGTPFESSKPSQPQDSI